MKRAFVISIMAMLIYAPVYAGDIEGRATVVDGDTIAIEGADSRIRLWGIDAPEGRQTCENVKGRRYLCGPRAAGSLAKIIGRNGRVICREKGRDRYRRIVAICMAGGRDIGEEMVRRGWAVDYPEYSEKAYAALENEARTARRGLWSGKFILPWRWRAGERLSSEQNGDGQKNLPRG